MFRVADRNKIKFMEDFEENTKFDDTLINELAPKLVEGVDMLKKWSESI